MSRPVTLRFTPLFAAALILAPGGSDAQSSAVVDEGTLTITQRGVPLGRESFRIARTPAPGGQVFRATGQAALGDRRITSVLGTDSAGVPVSYESEVTVQGAVVQRLQGRGRPGRFSILNNTKAGESAREYVLTNGALLLDGDFLHQYSFVPLVADRGHTVVNVIAPRTGVQVQLRLDAQPADSVEIGGGFVASRHFTLTSADGSRRDVWVDSTGRLLKVSLAETGVVATRDDPPR